VRGQELAPIGKELRVVVLACPMGLEAGSQVNLYTVLILTWNTWRGGRGLRATKPP
jgi:hypothetical protein